MRQPVDGQHVVTQQRRYLVTRASDQVGTTTIAARAGGRTVVRHVPPAGFVAQSPVVIDDRWALIQEIRSDGPDRKIRAYRYDLGSGTKTDLSQTALPPIAEPEIGAYDGTFAYSTTDRQKRSCLVIATLDSLKARTVTCVDDPAYIADPVVSADAVTFSQIADPQTPSRCKRLFTVPLAGGQPRAVPAVAKCIQWSGATLRGATIWSEVSSTDPDQYQSKAYLRETADAAQRPLGNIATDTIVPCGEWIYWQVRTVRDGGERFQLDRWQSGRSRPETIYSAPADAAVTAPTCQDGIPVIEVAHLGAKPTYTEALQLR
ncbi:hypothetical protein E1263_37390 [Kribbella antibiotica]|uniref:Uncharacterized protein n=1 Tax=Kribbella antibiotica TaxID=190195 RepID=A0A4R4YM02_9ACTN|nr:hypothetical protein E1263_37390 [Kribbella antibiotica]